ncbi:MAG: DUF4177 domain-containing protein [Peptococcaceae bacterium]|nr:DUF4177 domain-containing protein [Peptococcaceae bacterium]MBQ2449314.1 DUF4177 domain-containing protein [Peptococcaceae bacterium]
MYTYEYETISCEFDGWGLVYSDILKTKDYRYIIDKRASEGWRYVGYIPVEQRATGHVQKLDLIFEKEV